MDNEWLTLFHAQVLNIPIDGNRFECVCRPGSGRRHCLGALIPKGPFQSKAPTYGLQLDWGWRQAVDILRQENAEYLQRLRVADGCPCRYQPQAQGGFSHGSMVVRGPCDALDIMT